MLKKADLVKILSRIEGRGYKAYQDIRGSYEMGTHLLYIDHVQGDPFASPSRVRVQVPLSRAGFPDYLLDGVERKVALGDILARRAEMVIARLVKGRRGTGKSGMIHIDAGEQEVLPRTAVRIGTDYLEARISVGLPAAGRTVLGHDAASMLTEELGAVVEGTFFMNAWKEEELRRHVWMFEDQNWIRSQLKALGLVAFIGNGSVLPRKSGISNKPMTTSEVVRFFAPSTLEVVIDTKHHGPITGMGIPTGVTLIVGGGYHGKSTLLKAIERGIYNHIAGDGREWVITNPTAVKIRAEDGRYVQKVDITTFISNLPSGEPTSSFTTENASGSTSQAANIIEALEMGAEVLLLDEDTSATNFMIRDARMQMLVPKEKEPITPYIDRVQQLYREKGVSTIIVMGGAGDYFDVCDTVIMMDNYRPHDVTKEAKLTARQLPTKRQPEVPGGLPACRQRVPLKESFNPFRGRKVKAEARGLHTVVFGELTIDLSLVEQIVDSSQTRAIADIILYCTRYVDGQRSLRQVLELVYEDITEKGLDVVSPFYGQHPGDLAFPRILETAAAINRMRTLRVKN